MKNSSYTLLEIMIVAAIIGMLAVIAIPSYVRSRDNSRFNVCINNLRHIDGAKEQLATASDLTTADLVSWDMVMIYLRSSPQCKASGVYQINRIGTNPTCSYSGAPTHALP